MIIIYNQKANRETKNNLVKIIIVKVFFLKI